MSYILEALRKADAERERERGAVPDLHAQLIPLTAGRVDDEPAHTPIGWWIGIGCAVLLLGLLVWWWLATVGGTAPAVAPTAALAPAATPVTAASTPSAARPIEPVAAASSVVAAAPTAVVAGASTAPTPASAPAASTAAAAPVAPVSKALHKAEPGPAVPSKTSPATPANPRAAAPQRPPQSSANASPDAPAPAKPALPPPPARVPPLAELPEDVRRQVPVMAMGGSVYSPEPQRRMIIVNGQVFVEGSTLAPELRLETINPKSAVFSIRGQRFQVPL